MSLRPPSVDVVLKHDAVAVLVEQHGRPKVVEAIRYELEAVRKVLGQAGADTAEMLSDSRIAQAVNARLAKSPAASLRPVFNLTGVLLHTNLGRALLPEVTVLAMQDAARHAVNIEFELADGKPGDRDRHLETLLRRLTGAEEATVVNNNAAAVLLALNTLPACMTAKCWRRCCAMRPWVAKRSGLTAPTAQKSKNKVSTTVSTPARSTSAPTGASR